MISGLSVFGVVFRREVILIKVRFIVIPIVAVLLSFSVPFVSTASNINASFYSGYILHRYWDKGATTIPSTYTGTGSFPSSESASFNATNCATRVWDILVNSLWYNNTDHTSQFIPGYSYSYNAIYSIRWQVTENITLFPNANLNPLFSASPYFCRTPNNPSGSSFKLYSLSSYFGDENVNYYYTLNLSVSPSGENTTHNVTGTIVTTWAFHVPDDFESPGSLFFCDRFSLTSDAGASPNGIATANMYCTSSSMVCLYDPEGVSFEDDSTEIEQLVNATNQAALIAHHDAEALQGLIQGDGSFGNPESDAVSDIDNYLDYESSMLGDLGYDTLDADNFMDNVLDVVDFENIDVPSHAAGDWFHRVLNPVMIVFPFFVIFPLIVGLLGTLLGRRAK